MKTEKAVKLYNSITNIKDEIIEEAQTIKPNRKQPVWLKWGTIAACFVFILAVSVPFLSNLITRGDKQTVHPLNVISFHDAYYEMIDFNNTNTLTLNRYNLPHQIDSSMMGNCVGTAKREKDSSLVFLYEYIPQNNTTGVGPAVYIVNDSNEYRFALFCNFTDANANRHPIQDLLNVYTIYNSSDIRSIAIFETGNFKNANDKTLKSTITDASKIEAFYNDLLISTPVGIDGIQNVERNDPEWITLKVESISGAIAYFRYCSDVQYVDWALNCYQVPSTFDAWMDE